MRRLLVAMAVVQAVLTAVVVVIAVLLYNSNSDLSHKIQVSAYKSCVSGNKTRLTTGSILDEILSLPKTVEKTVQIPSLVASRAAHLAALKARIDVTYHKQDNCALDR